MTNVNVKKGELLLLFSFAESHAIFFTSLRQLLCDLPQKYVSLLICSYQIV